ncbi:MAG: hypothetical protein WDO69_05615 [Pseudomonadota bacterium]
MIVAYLPSSYYVVDVKPQGEVAWSLRKVTPSSGVQQITGARAKHILALQTRIRALHELAENWDSYGAKPPTLSSLKTLGKIAPIFLERAGDSAALAGLHIGPSSGGVHIEWDVGSRTLEVEIEPTGEASVTRCAGDTDESKGLTVLDQVASDLDWLLG